MSCHDCGERHCKNCNPERGATGGEPKPATAPAVQTPQTAPLTKEERQALRSLLYTAPVPAGGWRAVKGQLLTGVVTVAGTVDYDVPPHVRSEYVPRSDAEGRTHVDIVVPRGRSYGDCELIAAAVNALPRLLTQLDAAEARIERDQGWIDQFQGALAAETAHRMKTEATLKTLLALRKDAPAPERSPGPACDEPHGGRSSCPCEAFCSCRRQRDGSCMKIFPLRAP